MRCCFAVLLAFAASVVAGCDSAHVKTCEAQLLEKLKAPSTYKRIGVDQMTLNAGKPPHYYYVEIEYDAQNSYGALLRDKEVCRYRLDSKGQPTLTLFDPYAADTDLNAADLEADAALEAAGAALEAAGDAIETAENAVDDSNSYSSDYEETYDAEAPAVSEIQSESNTQSPVEGE